MLIELDMRLQPNLLAIISIHKRNIHFLLFIDDDDDEDAEQFSVFIGKV